MDEKTKMKIQQRADRLAEWWPLISEPYESMISRSEETSSVSGFDDSPTTRMCECRLEWRRGKLCLACDNTGWRPATAEERSAGGAVDPYSAQVSSGVTIVRDESPASRRARESERNDAIISGLQRDARIRAGVESAEDTSMRQFRMVARKTRTERRIIQGIELLRQLRPELYARLPERKGLVALAAVMYHLIPGRIPSP